MESLVIGTSAYAAKVSRRSVETLRTRFRIPRMVQLYAPRRCVVVPYRQLLTGAARYGGVTDSTGSNRGGEACRVPSSRKTIGKHNCQHAVCIRCLIN